MPNCLIICTINIFTFTVYMIYMYTYCKALSAHMSQFVTLHGRKYIHSTYPTALLKLLSSQTELSFLNKPSSQSIKKLKKCSNYTVYTWAVSVRVHFCSCFCMYKYTFILGGEIIQAILLFSKFTYFFVSCQLSLTLPALVFVLVSPLKGPYSSTPSLHVIMFLFNFT